MITILVCFACELAWIFAYGLLLNSYLPMLFFFIAAFVIPLCVYIMFHKKIPFKEKDQKMLWAIIFSLAFAAVSLFMYEGINRISSDYVAEYEVEVESCLYNNGGTAYFTDPIGRDASAALNDYRIVKKDDDYVKPGDVIKVREDIGFFGDTFYILVEEIE